MELKVFLFRSELLLLGLTRLNEATEELGPKKRRRFGFALPNIFSFFRAVYIQFQTYIYTFLS